MRIHLVWLIILATLCLTACNLPSNTPAQTQDLALIIKQTQTAIIATGLSGITPAPTTPLPPALTKPAASAVPGQLPPPASACTNQAKFVTETVPDGSAFAPNTPFIKTWTIQNVGTCTWSTEYALVFSRGEQMGGTSPQPIGENVPPGNTLKIYLPQTSPAAAGEHQGFWMLRSTQGRDFGLGQDAATAFWVKINVAPGATGPSVAPVVPIVTPPAPTFPTAAAPTPAGVTNLGAPTRSWNFANNQSPFYLGDDNRVSFQINNNILVVTAFAPGDQWRVAENSFVDNFAVQANFVTGSQCSQRDSYGVVVRAPAQPNNVINSGYVFSFNCQGQFRAYRMDGGNYVGLYEWAAAPNIQSGPNQENVMLVTGQGSLLTLYANGQPLLQLNDPTYANGLYGVMIGSAGTPNLQVGLRQLHLWDLP